jgi:hypothetical protein
MKTEQTNEIARLREALELIASPKQPDGTYNRSREACEQLAKEALATSPEESRCEAGIYTKRDRCSNKATLTTRGGYKCCKYHAPCISEGKYRDDVVSLSEKTIKVSDKESLIVETEWRELGQDEVIQEGDEVMDIQGDCNQAIISIGRTPGDRCTKARRRS